MIYYFFYIWNNIKNSFCHNEFFGVLLLTQDFKGICYHCFQCFQSSEHCLLVYWDQLCQQHFWEKSHLIPEHVRSTATSFLWGECAHHWDTAVSSNMQRLNWPALKTKYSLIFMGKSLLQQLWNLLMCWSGTCVLICHSWVKGAAKRVSQSKFKNSITLIKSDMLCTFYVNVHGSYFNRNNYAKSNEWHFVKIC